jgi:pyruvate kinase
VEEKKKLLDTLCRIETAMVKEAEHHTEVLHKVHDEQKVAAQNLIHYLTLRNLDLRKLQDDLHMMGLSSLASSESHIRSQLQAINILLGKKYSLGEKESCDYSWSIKNRGQKSEQIFGEKSNSHLPSLMVTLDGGFSEDYAMMKKLLLKGMNIARINCAHDDVTVWEKMIHLLKKACRKTGKSCKIYMDLAGPKFRTKLINKGAQKGKTVLEEGQTIYLAYENDRFRKDDVVIHPGEETLMASLKKGDRVFIDDGKIKGTVTQLKGQVASVRVTRISNAKKTIKNEKGINFPDTEMDIPSLTPYDMSCLPFVCHHADIVGYSFVRHASDIENLWSSIKPLTEDPPHLVIKVETAQAVRNLPDILLEGMKQPVLGVMIARGDLAVEIGFERLSEIQEEILWICDAAHVPVIWATQVLETLNKSGLATRSELTDAVLAAQAECVMLNKGSHTLDAMDTLMDIIQRQSFHRSKKRYVFRPLNIAKEFVKGTI